MDPNMDLSKLNYTVPVPYNGTIATGGNSLVDNLNIYYEVCLPVLSLDQYTIIGPSAHTFLSRLVTLPGCSHRQLSSCS